MSRKSINKHVSEEAVMPILYLTIGIPGSGKSTWTMNNLANTCKIIALDNIRKEVYGFFPQELDDELEKKIWDIATLSSVESLHAGTNTVIDSMALTKSFRRRIISGIESIGMAKFYLIAVFLDTPLNIALDRNSKREKKVLETTIRNLAAFLEAPSEDEGFQEIIRIIPEL